MKTYVSEYTAGTKGSRSNRTGWLIEITYNASSTLYFASWDCTLTGAGTAIGCAIDVSGINSRIDPQTADWSHGRVSITLADSRIGGTALDSITNKTLAGLFRQKQFKGRSVSIWRINESMTTVTGHDKEYIGYISDVTQSIDGSSFTFICESWPEKSRKEIPQTVITEADYPLAPKESIGQRLPIVYGTFENKTGESGERDMLINNFHYVPSVCIDASIGKFVFAGHEVNSLVNTNIAIYDPSLQNYIIGIYANTSGGVVRPTVSTTNPAYVHIESPANLYWWTADSIYLIPTVKGGKDSGKTANRQYLYNQALYDGASVLTTDAINQYCMQRFISLSAAIEFWKTSLAADNVLWVYISATTGSPTYRLVVWNGITAAGDESSTGGTVPGWHSYNFGQFGDRSELDGTAISTTFQWTIEELSRYEYGLKCETSGDTVSINAICLEIKKPIIASATLTQFQTIIRPNNGVERDAVPNPFEVWTYDRLGFIPRRVTNIESINASISRSAVFAEIKGREFGSWIDDAARSNTKSAGDLINESSFQIESILRDELGFDDSSIEVDDFDAAESGRSNTHFSINQAVDAYRVIREISQATTSITWPSAGGKWRHFILPQDPEGDATYDMLIDWSDINPISWYQTGSEEMCNKLTVRYHYDYGRGSFTKEHEVENTTSQGSTASGYNHIFDRTLSIPYFRFDSSSGATNYAQEFATLFVSHWKDPHAVFEFDMLNHSKFELDCGDVVVFDNFERNIGAIGMGASGDYWSSINPPGTIYWLITSATPMLDKITYTAFNLHQLV